MKKWGYSVPVESTEAHCIRMSEKCFNVLFTGSAALKPEAAGTFFCKGFLVQYPDSKIRFLPGSGSGRGIHFRTGETSEHS